MLKKILSYPLSTISFFTSPHSYTSREILRRVDNITMRDIHRFAKASTSMKADALIRDDKKKKKRDGSSPGFKTAQYIVTFLYRM